MDYRRDGKKVTVIYDEKTRADFVFTSKDDSSIATVMLAFIKLQDKESVV